MPEKLPPECLVTGRDQIGKVGDIVSESPSDFISVHPGDFVGIRKKQRQRGWKLYSFHAPEVECIGKSKAAAPYEFGVKASIVTNNRRAPGGLFVLHARALPDNPYDGHTLRDVIDRTETLTGCPIERAYLDKGYRGHDAQNPRRVFISGQKRGVFGVIKRELRRRSAIEPIIGHLRPMVTSAAATSKAALAMRPTSSSRPSATTSAASSPG